MCQAEVKQGPNCVEVTGVATNPIYVAITCQECTGGGSDVKCEPAEKATAASLAIKNAMNLTVPGSFTATGVTCDIGMPLYKFGGTLGGGQYKVTVTASGLPEVEVLSFTVGGAPASDGPVNPKDQGTTPKHDLGTMPRTEKGAPIALDPKGYTEKGAPIVGYDERGKPIIGGGGDSGGCGCELAGAPSPLALYLLGLSLLALLTRRRR
jgi:MYXO-CTERM domain-containing protein